MQVSDYDWQMIRDMIAKEKASKRKVGTATRKVVDCPFCETDGCCFCDHEGKIYVGENELIKSEEALNSIGVKYLKATNPDEIWPEMWEYSLDEKNVPEWFKLKHNYS